MESKVCVICNTDKSIDIFYNKHRKCKHCNIQRNMKRYCEKKDNLSNQRKLYYETNREVLPAKSKLNQQKREDEREIYKQQKEDFNKKLEDLTQAFELLKTPNS